MTTCPSCGRYVADSPSIRRWRAQGRLLSVNQVSRGLIDLVAVDRLAPWERDYFDRFMARWKRRKVAVAMRTCQQCGLETDWPEGSCQCPVYHTDTTCPIFVDGKTRAEVEASR